jgi:transposase
MGRRGELHAEKAMSEKQYKDWNPAEQYILPPSPRDWLPEEHPVYVLLEIVAELDLSSIDRKYQAKDPRGTRPYPPEMMTALLLYGYSTGVYSSGKLEKATYEDIPFRVVCAGNHPDHTRISEFRRVHLEELREIFVQVLQICDRMGLVELGDIAFDGTKVQASASKHKAMSYERMLQQEERLQDEIDELLGKAEEVDQQEDDEYGRESRGNELPEELQRRKDRLEQIQEAKQQLEEEARQARAKDLEEQAQGHAETAQTHEDETVRKRAATQAENRSEESREMANGEEVESFETPEGMPKHRPKRQQDGRPKDKAQRNFTDPESRIMKKNGTYLQGYNGQAAVDEAAQIIVAYGLTNQASDAGNLTPMLTEVEANLGKLPDRVVADSGYWSSGVVGDIEQTGVDPYIATGREKTREGPTAEGKPPEEADEHEKMCHKLRTPEGRERYSRRKYVVEPVFGQMKEAREFRRFHLRGLEKARGEWSLVCTGHNLQKLYGAFGAQTGNAGVDGGW